MQEQQAPQRPTTRGIVLTINEKGNIEANPIGHLNEAELLGFGTYLNNILNGEGFAGLANLLVPMNDALGKVVKAIEELASKENGEDECSKESCLEHCPSSDSGPCSGNCQDQSEEPPATEE